MSERFDDLFTIESRDGDDFTVQAAGEGFLFGGLTMAILQSVGSETASADLDPMSLRTSFLAMGDPTVPMDVSVERVNDSRSFVGRRVRISQSGHAVAVGDLSFKRPRDGESWCEAFVPDAAPEDLAPASAVHTSMPVMEVRHLSGPEPEFTERMHPYWARFPVAPSGEPRAWAAAVAYASDYFVINTPFPVGSGSGRGRRGTTVEHALWYHRPTDPSDWMHLDARRLSIDGDRFTSRGEVHDGSGMLVASFTQTGIVRTIEPG